MQAAGLAALRDDLAANLSLSLNAVALNAAEPMACVMPAMGALCDAAAHTEAAWQAPMVAAARGMPVLQDEAALDVWQQYGGGHDDLFIYDRRGALFAHLCSAHTCAPQPVPTDLGDARGRASVRAAVVLAARAPACAAAAPGARGDGIRRAGDDDDAAASASGAGAVIAGIVFVAVMAGFGTVIFLGKQKDAHPPPPAHEDESERHPRDDDDIELMEHRG